LDLSFFGTTLPKKQGVWNDRWWPSGALLVERERDVSLYFRMEAIMSWMASRSGGMNGDRASFPDFDFPT